MNRILLLLVLLFLFAWQSESFAQSRFEPARPRYSWSFPRDHGAHPQFQTEWWYYTGNLWPDSKAVFDGPSSYGFQLTFFRRGNDTVHKDPAWNDNYLAHAAFSSFGERGRYLFAERRARGGLGIAGAALDGLNIWNHSWGAKAEGATHQLNFSVPSESGEVAFDLLVDSASTPPLLHGDRGFSRKASCESCASNYYSFPGVPIAGTIIRPQGQREKVHGVVWMDHEFMTNTLLKEQSGWDWFSLMNRDGSRLMLFRVRGKEGSEFFSGTYLTSAGVQKTLKQGDFQITELTFWTSARSGARYPISWQVDVPSVGFSKVVTARLDAQEIIAEDKNTPTYWEGAIVDPSSETVGYLEMTGYADAGKP